MSLSLVARTRFQSVLEAFEEDRFFILSRSAKRDDMNALGRFGVSDGNRNTTEKAERDKALLSISEAVIFKGEGRTFEHARRIQEVDAVSLQVDRRFLSSQVKRICGLYIQPYVRSKRPLSPL